MLTGEIDHRGEGFFAKLNRELVLIAKESVAKNMVHGNVQPLMFEWKKQDWNKRELHVLLDCSEPAARILMRLRIQQRFTAREGAKNLRKIPPGLIKMLLPLLELL